MTLCDSMDCRLPGSSVHRTLQTRILEWIVIPFSRESSWSWGQTWSPSLQADSLSSEPPGKSYSSQSVWKYWRGENSKIILWCHHHLDNKTRHYEKKKKRTKEMKITGQNTDAKIVNTILAIHKKVIYHDQVALISGSWGTFTMCKWNNVIFCVNKRKDKSHMTISIDAEKTFDEIQHSFMIKSFTNVSIEET